MTQHPRCPVRRAGPPFTTGRPGLDGLAAAALPVLGLAQIPWWVAAPYAALPVAGQVRALLRERADRSLDAQYTASVRAIDDPVQRARLLLEYRHPGSTHPQPPPGVPEQDAEPPPDR